MIRFLLNISQFIGFVFGFLLRCIGGAKWEFPLYRMRRAFATELKKGMFAEWGKGSLLAPGVQLCKPQFISVGNHVSIMSHCVLEICGTPHGKIRIADGVSLGEYSHITSAGSVEIGEGVLTGRFVLITDNMHGRCDSEESLAMPPLVRPVYFKQEVVIGKNVWIGDKVSILPGVHIGEGAVIGANSVVTHDIPAYCIAAGIPARVVKNIKA